MINEVDNRWIAPWKCDGCSKEECYTEESIFPPDFTFTWCRECAKDQKKCDAIITEVVTKYWEKHPRPKPKKESWWKRWWS